MIYDFWCRDCEVGLELMCTSAEYEKKTKEVEIDGRRVVVHSDMICPLCEKPMTRIYGAPAIKLQEIGAESGKGYRQKMKRRYAERNKRIQAMPEHVQKRLAAFGRKHGVKRGDW